MYYLNYFFIMSIIGHLIETFVYYNNESGILYGWWTPIYGIGTIIILLINKYIETKTNVKGFKKIITIFLTCSIFLSIIEAIGGYLIEFIFHKTFWDYSYYRFNIGKYAALEMSLIWGLSGILVVYFIKPLIDKIIDKIPKYLTYILSMLFIIDLLLTIIIKH